jgi:hypothetical protein
VQKKFQLVYAFAVSPNAVDSSRNSVEVGHLRIQRQQPTDAGNSSSPSSSSVVGKEEDEKVEYSISAAENGGSAGGRRFVLGRKTGFLLYTGPFERDSSNHTLKVGSPIFILIIARALLFFSSIFTKKKSKYCEKSFISLHKMEGFIIRYHGVY